MGVTSGGAPPMNPHLQQGTGLPGQQPAQGLTALLVMIAVLCILLAYCFWGAPWCRAFCRRRVCCFCPMDDPEGMDGSSSVGGGKKIDSSPPLILWKLLYYRTCAWGYAYYNSATFRENVSSGWGPTGSIRGRRPWIGFNGIRAGCYSDTTISNGKLS